MSKQPIADNNHAHPFYEIKFSKRICDMSKCPPCPPPHCFRLSVSMSIYPAIIRPACLSGGLWVCIWLTDSQGLRTSQSVVVGLCETSIFIEFFSNEFLLPQPCPPPLSPRAWRHTTSRCPLSIPKKWDSACLALLKITVKRFYCCKNGFYNKTFDWKQKKNK